MGPLPGVPSNYRLELPEGLFEAFRLSAYLIGLTAQNVLVRQTEHHPTHDVACDLAHPKTIRHNCNPGYFDRRESRGIEIGGDYSGCDAPRSREPLFKQILRQMFVSQVANS